MSILVHESRSKSSLLSPPPSYFYLFETVEAISAFKIASELSIEVLREGPLETEMAE